MFNVALVVHGEEALLAVGFIFTIHFFNGHLRPGKFPMDRVIFTGVVSERVREERAPNWNVSEAKARLVREGAPPPTRRQMRTGVVGADRRRDGLERSIVGLIICMLFSRPLSVVAATDSSDHDGFGGGVMRHDRRRVRS